MIENITTTTDVHSAPMQPASESLPPAESSTRVLGTTGSRGSKQEDDKFYTKPEIVDDLLTFLSETVTITDFDVVVEPSAGNGAFSQKLRAIHPHILAYDLKPEASDIMQADWFQLDTGGFEKYKQKLIVGNPPFGFGGKLAIEFMRHGAFADVIAFVLPKGCKKASTMDRMPEYFHLIAQTDLPRNSFTLDGVNYHVPCVFQIWEKRSEKRERFVARTTSPLLEFTTKEECDFRIQRVGGNAGKASFDLNFSIASNYFVKNTSRIHNSEFVTLINSLTFEGIDDTTGPRSLSKHELITTVEKAIGFC